jgi:broad specificity phosphatase PhoE
MPALSGTAAALLRCRAMTTLLFIRHGENPANITHQLSARVVDHPLTDRGRQQAALLADHLAAGHEGRIGAVFSSPLVRARQTAEIIGAAVGLPVSTIEGLRELDVGELDGRSDDEAWRLHDEVYHAWLAGRTDVAFAGGESLPVLLDRFAEAMRHVAQGTPHGRAVVVGHGGILRVAIANLFAATPEIMAIERIGNCSITEIELDVADDGRVGGQVIGCARAEHLASVV